MNLDYAFSYPVTVNDEGAADYALGVAEDLFGARSEYWSSPTLL